MISKGVLAVLVRRSTLIYRGQNGPLTFVAGREPLNNLVGGSVAADTDILIIQSAHLDTRRFYGLRRLCHDCEFSVCRA